MRYINWLIRILLFVVLLGFALKNSETVTLRYFFGLEWETSLVIALLIAFVAGVLIGLFAMLPGALRRRREVSRLKREVRDKDKLIETGHAIESISASSRQISE